jgi:hypothetical protein
VLTALEAGRLTGLKMEGASGANWLGLTRGELVHSLVAELRRGVAVGAAAAASFDVADLEKRRVRAVPLLLQVGLLSRSPGRPQHCQPPNEYASASLQHMLGAAMESDEDADGVSAACAGFNAALTQRSPATLEEAAKSILRLLPSAMFKESKTSAGAVRESGYHAALAGALVASAPRGVMVDLEKASGGGRADIVLRFGAGEEAWVLEVGVGVDSGSKLLQAQVYGEAQLEPRVLCCAVVVAKQGSASTVAIGSAAPLVITVAWSQRTRKAGGGGAGRSWVTSCWVAPATWLFQRPSLEWQYYQWKKPFHTVYYFSPLLPHHRLPGAQG